MTPYIISLGSNLDGPGGAPRDNLFWAIDHLRQAGIVDPLIADVVVSKPVGFSRQPDFHNTIATGVTELSANTLLRHAKAVEKAAGRNPGVRFGPRPIDIDLIDYGGRIVRWPPVSRAWRQLTLPHPRAHLRSFVLIPLIQIQPEWRHPVFGVSPEALLKRLPIRDQRL